MLCLQVAYVCVGRIVEAVICLYDCVKCPGLARRQGGEETTRRKAIMYYIDTGMTRPYPCNDEVYDGEVASAPALMLQH